MSQITHDLAIVARVSRAGLPTLESTLAATLPKPAPDDALKLSRIFVARVARIAASVTVTAVVLGLFAFLQVPLHQDDGVYRFLLEYLAPFGDGDKLNGILHLLFVGAAAYAIAAHIAARRFAARPDRRRIEVLARAASSVPTAAVLVVVTFYGLAYVALGGDQLYDMVDSGFFPAANGVRHGISALMLLAIAISCLAAWRVQKLLPRPIWIGALIVAATIAVGLNFDVGPLANAFDGNWVDFDPALLQPSMALRATLTVTGTLGLFLVVAGAFQALRRREDA